jgi:phospho-N-acetylmuramoyl-pentapeptide-transferase
MLVWLSDYLIQFDNSFSVLQYITVRGIFSILTALGISLLIGPTITRSGKLCVTMVRRLI